jgi:hypothetical protein
MWSIPIDLYCERVSPSFWAEPVNAVSNLAFLIAAIAALICGGAPERAIALSSRWLP